MSLSVQHSVIEQFSFDKKTVRSIYVRDVGQCVIAKDVYKVLGYGRKAGVQAIKRLVPEKYKIRLRDADVDFQEILQIEYLHPDTVLLKESGLYCFLLRCGKGEAEPFMDWVIETVLPREV